MWYRTVQYSTRCHNVYTVFGRCHVPYLEGPNSRKVCEGIYTNPGIQVYLHGYNYDQHSTSWARRQRGRLSPVRFHVAHARTCPSRQCGRVDEISVHCHGWDGLCPSAYASHRMLAIPTCIGARGTRCDHMYAALCNRYSGVFPSSQSNCISSHACCRTDFCSPAPSYDTPSSSSRPCSLMLSTVIWRQGRIGQYSAPTHPVLGRSTV